MPPSLQEKKQRIEQCVYYIPVFAWIEITQETAKTCLQGDPESWGSSQKGPHRHPLYLLNSEHLSIQTKSKDRLEGRTGVEWVVSSRESLRQSTGWGGQRAERTPIFWKEQIFESRIYHSNNRTNSNSVWGRVCNVSISMSSLDAYKPQRVRQV